MYRGDFKSKERFLDVGGKLRKVVGWVVVGDGKGSEGLLVVWVSFLVFI